MICARQRWNSPGGGAGTRISGVSGAGFGQAETATVCVEAQPDSRQRMASGKDLFIGDLLQIGIVGRIGLRLSGFRLSAGLGYELRARPLVGHLLRVDALDENMVMVDPERPNCPRSDRPDRDQLKRPLRHPGPAEQGGDEAHDVPPEFWPHVTSYHGRPGGHMGI